MSIRVGVAAWLDAWSIDDDDDDDDDLDGQGLRSFDVHLVDNRIRIIVQGLRGFDVYSFSLTMRENSAPGDNRVRRQAGSDAQRRSIRTKVNDA